MINSDNTVVSFVLNMDDGSTRTIKWNITGFNEVERESIANSLEQVLTTTTGSQLIKLNPDGGDDYFIEKSPYGETLYDPVQKKLFLFENAIAEKESSFINEDGTMQYVSLERMLAHELSHYALGTADPIATSAAQYDTFLKTPDAEVLGNTTINTPLTAVDFGNSVVAEIEGDSATVRTHYFGHVLGLGHNGEQFSDYFTKLDLSYYIGDDKIERAKFGFLREPGRDVEIRIDDNDTKTDLLIGINGNDTLVAGGGRDFLFGGDGNDVLVGGVGSDVLVGGNGDDILIGGTITVEGTAIDDTVSDLLVGGDGFDTYKISIKHNVDSPNTTAIRWSDAAEAYVKNRGVLDNIDYILDTDNSGNVEISFDGGTGWLNGGGGTLSLGNMNLVNTAFFENFSIYSGTRATVSMVVDGLPQVAEIGAVRIGSDLVFLELENFGAIFGIRDFQNGNQGIRNHSNSIDTADNGGLAEGDGDNNLITGSVGDDTAIGKGGSDTYLDLGKSGTDVVTDVGSASDVDRVDLTSQSFADTVFARGGAPTVNSQTALIGAASTTYQPGTNDLVITGIAGSSLAGTLIIRDYFGGLETGIEQIALSDRVLSLQDVLAILNTAPSVDEPIVDQTATEGQEWSFTVPATSFSDTDGDALTYSASLADGSPLPDWLSFDAATRTFTGTPPQGFDGNLSLSVTAHDGIAGVTDTFELTINDTPFTGTAGDDVLHGDGNANILSGLGGNDVIHGYGGDDTLIGGAGADSLLGGDGNDTVYADADDAWFSGDAGIDTLIYQGTDDRQYAMDQGAFENMEAGGGNNTVWGTAANNVINGQAGNDVIHGYGGNDTLIGGAGADSLLGGDGNDTVYADADDVWFSGDAGVDTLIYQGTDDRQYAMDQGAFENMQAGAGNNTVWGTAANNVIDGQAGNDVIHGYGGDDTLIGGAGADSLLGGDGNDTVYADADDTWFSGDAGIDTLIYTGADNRQYSLAQGAFENAHMGSGNNVVWGTDAANTIDGQAGNDTLFGYGGSDRIIGGAGSDYLVGGAGNDTFVFAFGDTGHDTVADFGTGDVIEFDSSLFGTFADVLASASDDGVNTYITIDADTSIRLDNILVGQLQIDDFHFV
ncbi:putative Ig domain-containing protein [Roseibium sediminis]|uniref:putative Ig domain-containing protein n=1 Tax=Roseibium sediminis TaxID=1775174 RepID=UPI00123C87E0|nr:putative Ig domain-containing protein [Roseibium sediminis]